MVPDANMGAHASIFEATHGSAPDIVGKGVADSSAPLLATAMALDHFKRTDKAPRQALDATLNTDQRRKSNLGDKTTTTERSHVLASKHIFNWTIALGPTGQQRGLYRQAR